jgi:hypothetical protein
MGIFSYFFLDFICPFSIVFSYGWLLNAEQDYGVDFTTSKNVTLPFRCLCSSDFCQDSQRN